MRISYHCPRCNQTNHVEFSPTSQQLTCAECGQAITILQESFDEQRLRRCLVCPSTDLYVRKDFPQRLGVTIVVIGFAASCVFWFYYMPIWAFACLFAPALIDLALHFVVGDALMCYRCGAVYRGVDEMQQHGRFSLETHEKHRQQMAREKSHDHAAST